MYDESYTYTSIHNIDTFDGTAYTHGSGNDSGTEDAGPHAVTDVGTAIDLVYDDNGNRVTKTENGTDVTTYVYNDENRLESVTMPNTEVIGMVYAADGQRVSRTNGDYSTVYVAGLLEVDSDGSGVTDSRTFYSFGRSSGAIAVTRGGATSFVFQNHLGSVSAAFNDETDALALVRFSPWGSERGSSGSLPSDHGFTGQVSDSTTAASGGTGLLYYKARYLDPGIGQFITPDEVIPEIDRPSDANRYAYVRGNPIAYVDPDGHAPAGTLLLDGGQCWTAECDQTRRNTAGAIISLFGSAGGDRNSQINAGRLAMSVASAGDEYGSLFDEYQQSFPERLAAARADALRSRLQSSHLEAAESLALQRAEQRRTETQRLAALDVRNRNAHDHLPSRGADEYASAHGDGFMTANILIGPPPMPANMMSMK